MNFFKKIRSLFQRAAEPPTKGTLPVFKSKKMTAKEQKEFRHNMAKFANERAKKGLPTFANVPDGDE